MIKDIDDLFVRICSELKDTDIEDYLNNRDENLSNLKLKNTFLEIFSGFGEGSYYSEFTQKLLSEPNMKISCVVSYDGIQHDGGEIYDVFKVEFLNTNEIYYFQYTGSYISWDDDFWNAMPKLVKPVEVTITEWQTI